MNSVALAIKIVADARAAGQQIDGFDTKVTKMGKASKVAGRLLAAGLVAGVAAAGAMVKAAAEDEAAQVKLASALRNSAGARDKDIASVEKWIEKQGRALGVADDQLRPALESLVSATKDVTKAQELASLAMDIAARKGESVESVSKKLAKAYATGNVGALAKYGVATKNAEGKTRSLAAVQKDLTKDYKGAAADAADTAAGKMQKLSVRVDELKEKYGAKLLPILLLVAAAGLKVVDWIDKNETKAAVLAGSIVGLVAAVASINAAEKAWTAISKAFTAVQTAMNVVLAANPIVLVVVAVVALVAILVLAYKKSDTFKRIVDKAFRAVADAGKYMWDNVLKPAFAKMVEGLEAVGKAGIWLWNNALQPSFKFIVKGIAAVLELWAKMLGVLGKVPGFGWAKDAAEAMGKAADKANEIANGIQKIQDKRVTVTVQYKEINRPPGVGGSGINSGTGRVSGGYGGNVNVTVYGFVGDEITLIRKIRDGLAADRVRLGRN